MPIKGGLLLFASYNGRSALYTLIPILAFLLGGVTSRASDAGGSFSVYGTGTKLCGTYLSDRLADTPEHKIGKLAFETWLEGFFTAFNERTAGANDILQGVDIDFAFREITRYCKKHPTERFARAASILADIISELKPSAVSTARKSAGPETPIIPLPETTGSELPKWAQDKYSDVDFVMRPWQPQTGTMPAYPGWVPPKAAVVADNPYIAAGAKKVSPADDPYVAAGSKRIDAASSQADPVDQESPGPEVVTVKYRGPVSLAPFKCDTITRSSFIERVCYDPPNEYMLIDLNGTWYHYCEIDAGTVSNLMAAESMGRFYNASIKGRFDCRTHRVPAY